MKSKRFAVAALGLLLMLAPGVAQAKSTKPVADLTPSIAQAAPGTLDPVWKPPHGKRFHRAGCPGIKGHKVVSLSRADAVAKFVTPCQICTP